MTLGCVQFNELRDVINQQFGVLFKPGDQQLVAGRLEGRVAELGLGNFADYLTLLRSTDGAGELMAAMERLTNNETYFFREDDQLSVFANHLLPQLARRFPKRQVTVWSAGCSSGEEVYTIAMLVLRSGLFNDVDVRVFGSDVSAKMVSRARAGVYTRSAFRNTSHGIRHQFFEEAHGRWRINDQVRKLCNFAQLNLNNPDELCVIGSFDIIFCRNVLMYFDKASRQSCVTSLYHRLNQGGYLLLGHTESLLNMNTPFETVTIGGVQLYRRVEGP